MQPSDLKNFRTALQSIADYYGKTLSDGVIDLYWQGLRDLDLDAICKALNRHAQNPDNGQFMPKIADIRKMLGGTTQDSALQAWAKVDRAVRTVGTYESVCFDDPIIHRVVMEMGGWVWLGGQNDDEWPFIAKRFEVSYRGYAARGCEDYPRHLIGIAEAQNNQGGFVSRGPTLIGDQARCQRVLTGGSDKPLLTVVRAGDVAQSIGDGGAIKRIGAA